MTAMASGALWNTLVLAARVETLWRLGWRCLPGVMSLLEHFGDAIGLSIEKRMIESIYRIMPVRNFSTDLLARVADQIDTIELKGVMWSDWGKPERIADTVRRLGIKPAFPIECIA